MLIQHYLQLLRRHRRLLVGIVAATTLGGMLLNGLLLAVRPVYTAVSSVVMLPTEAQLVFTQAWQGGSQEVKVQSQTETQIEYLKSRPVAEAALDKVRGARPPAEDGRGSGVAGALGEVTGFLSRLYRTLNSGKYVEPSRRDRAVRQLMAGTEIAALAGSYILKIKVNLRDPQLAADFANGLAEAYVERVAEQLEGTAAQLDAFLGRLAADRERVLAEIFEREHQLEQELGIFSLEMEQQFLLNARETERSRQSQAKVEEAELRAELEALESERQRTQRSSVLAKLSEQLAEGEARWQAIQQGDARRGSILGDLRSALDRLKEKEKPLKELARKRQILEADIEALGDQMLTINLTRASARSRVRVIEPAVTPVYPSSPKVVDNTVVAFAAGVLLALMALVAIDTFSDAVETAADLERLTGRRCLGSLSRPRMVEMLRTQEDSASLSAGSRSRAAELVSRLALSGSFDAPVIQVTGFLEPSDLADATAFLAATVAGHGSPASPHGAGEAAETPGAMPVEGLQPVSAQFRWQAAADRSPALVCVLPAGRIAHSVVEDFQTQAEKVELSALSFLLLET